MSIYELYSHNILNMYQCLDIYQNRYNLFTATVLLQSKVMLLHVKHPVRTNNKGIDVYYK